MRFSIAVLFIFLRLAVGQNFSDGHIYEYEGNDIQLTQLSDQIKVTFNPGIDENEQVRFLQKNLGFQFQNADERISNEGRIVRLRTGLSSANLNVIHKQLAEFKELKSQNPVFRQPGSKVRFTVDKSCIIRFAQPLNPQQMEAFKNKYDLRSINPITEETFRIFALDRNGLALANNLGDDPHVLWAQPNFIYLNWEILSSTVSDPLWPQQWAHVNTSQSVASGAGDEGFPTSVNGFMDADMDVDLAWDYLALNGSQAGGSASVLVAMLDSGVDLDHPDIQDNLFSTGQDFTSDGQSDANDTHGHGTCTAGIVAAVADNGQGVAGIAYNTKILPVRIMNVWGVTSTANLVLAVDYAWQQGADILSNSWGGTTPETALTEAINRAKTQGRGGLGCVILFSSGNEGRGIVNYPAYLEDVIAVGASNMFDEKKHSGARDYNHTWSSNYGSALDITAPTIVYTPDIQGTEGYVDGDYLDYFGGTSAACPNAAGVAALVLSANNSLNADAVQDVLEGSADKIERYSYEATGWNQHIGFGRVNALGAVQEAQSVDGRAPLVLHQVPQSGKSVENRLITAEISDASAVSIAQLFYRSIYDLDTTAWQALNDADGPIGNSYEFSVPGQKWGSQVQYYFFVQDGSAQTNYQTYPFGGSEIQAPPRPWMYHVGVLNTLNYPQSTPLSWDNNWKDYKRSTLNISDDHRIVDLNINLNFTGNLNEASIDLSATDDLGAGLIMRYEGGALTETNLDDEAIIDISQGADPFSGSYRADNGLFNFDGKSSSGTWKMGVYDGDYTGSNSGSIDNWSLDLTYILPNEPPVVSDIPNQTVSEGGSFNQIALDNFVSDADHPLDSLSWIYSGNQELTVTIDVNHMATIHIPDENWYGAETITFTASDPGAHMDSDAVQFTVISVNDPPVIFPISDQTIDEGEIFLQISLDNHVSDVDHSSAEMNWMVTGNTDLSVTIDPNRRATIAIPDTNWNGSETLKFKATDPGNLADSSTAVFTVNAVNDAPLITSNPPTTTFEDSLYAYQVDASDVDSGDILVYHFLQGPTFLSIDTLTGYISGVPTNDHVAEYDISIQVSDSSGAWDQQDYRLQVINVNDPPVVVDIPDQTIAEGQTFLSILLDNFVSDADNADSDINWTTSGTLQLVVEISAERIATIVIPDTNWNGQEQITFVASDPGALTDSSLTIFTVSAVNDAPIITSEPQLNVTQDQLYKYQVNATDVDSSEVLRYRFISTPDFLSIDSISGLVSGTPLNEHVGAHLIHVQVQDMAGAEDTQEYTLTVDNQNDPPLVLQIPSQTIDEGQIFSSITLDDYVSDPDHSDADIIWTVTGHQQLSVQIDEQRIATIVIPDTNWNGQEQITFRASDPGSLADSSITTFIVNAVNDVPVISSQPQINANQDQLYRYQLVATDADTGDVLTYHLITAPSFLGIDSVSGLISGTPLNEDVGQHQVIAQVEDVFGAVDRQDFQLTVDNENDPPRISEPLPVIHFAEDDSVDVAFESWYPFVEDVDNPDETLEYRVHNNHSELSSILLTDGYRFKANENWFGAESLLLRISDGLIADSAKFAVRVDPRNDPPDIINLPDSLVLYNSGTDTLKLLEYQFDLDTSDSLLGWTFEVSDTALLRNYDTDNSLLVLSAPGYIGEVQLYMTLIDDSSAIDYDSLLVIVKLETGMEDQGNFIPSQLVLHQNYPNPFNPQTIIAYQLPNLGKVTLSIYNNIGQKVRTLISERQKAGQHQVVFQVQNLSSGIYLYVLKHETDVSSNQIVRKMLFMK